MSVSPGLFSQVVKGRCHGGVSRNFFSEAKEGEVTLRTICLSLDPPTRGRMSDAKWYAAKPPSAFTGMLDGKDFGKFLLRVG